VKYGDRGFWVYDIILGVFVKHLVDTIEATGYSRAPFLDEALCTWRLAPFLDIGFPFEKSWTALQRQNVISCIEEVCSRLATRDVIPMDEIVRWSFGGESRLFHRGLKEVRTSVVVELGSAIVALLRNELPRAPKGEAWFFTGNGRSTIRMQPSWEG
jgi:hypothetical protein